MRVPGIAINLWQRLLESRLRKWLIIYEKRTTYSFVGSPTIIDAYTTFLLCGRRWEALRLRRRRAV